MSIGHNISDPAQSVTDRLELDFGEMLTSTETLLDEAAVLPAIIESNDDVSLIGGVVKKLRDHWKRGEAQRQAEAEPYLQAKAAVDNFFKRRITEPADAMGRKLNNRLDIYKQRELAAERARREAEATAARKAAMEAERARQDAELALRRARSNRTAEERASEAEAAIVEAEMAAVKAETTALASLQKASKIVGERFEGDRSGKVTMRKVPVVLIEDTTKLDLEALRPFLKREWLEQALRAWAKSTNHEQQMPGATVAMRDQTVVL